MKGQVFVRIRTELKVRCSGEFPGLASQVGGLAVALAAQDTLKNLFGTIMLLADKPFRVGERIIFGKYDGIVEEIGLRSTKIRLLNGHLATVPNNELASTDIENVGRRPFIKRSSVLEMRSCTPVTQVRRALEIVRAALENHEGIDGVRPHAFSFVTSKEQVRVWHLGCRF